MYATRNPAVGQVQYPGTQVRGTGEGNCSVQLLRDNIKMPDGAEGNQ